MTRALDPGLLDLAEHGYAVMRGAVPKPVVDSLLADMKALSANREPLNGADTPFLNRGHDVLYNLQREDVRYLRMFTGDAKIMAVLQGLLNDVWYKQIPQDRPNFILRSLIGRSSGGGVLPLHIDSFMPSSGSLCHSCQVAIVLEDQTRERGCTVVVPGSHRSDAYAEPAAFADAVPIESQAGDVVIWDSRLWHGALGNSTGETRWALIGTFVRWWVKQNFDVTGTLPEAVYAALTDDERAILGYCSMPPRDEYERTDIKSGHAQLRPRVADYLPR
jgi:Phytanoyl-CoA dioxygenase (PhyH)